MVKVKSLINKHWEWHEDKRDYTRAAEIYLKIEEFYPYSDSSRDALVNAIKSYHAGSNFNVDGALTVSGGELDILTKIWYLNFPNIPTCCS